MSLKEPHETFVRTDAELTQLWHDMMGRGGFDNRQLWTVVIAAGTGELCPAVQVIDDPPEEPDPLELAGFARRWRSQIDDAPLTLALLLARPGPVHMLESDRRWARVLRSAFRDLSPWPIHLATYERVRQFTPDDLIAA